MNTRIELDPISLEVYKHRFAAIADEMGAVLRRASFSPNIKERRDFSCALFDQFGQLIAQAAHIPVHLGSMPLSVSYARQHFSQPGMSLKAGDVIVLNNPYQGGTHLPDITLVSPVFLETSPANAPAPAPVAYVASRAHHADVGGMSPGSMPVAREIYQEGLIIPPVKLVEAGVLNQAIFDLILANVRTPEERLGDLSAQLAANRRGVARLLELYTHHGYSTVEQAMRALLLYTEKMTRKLISALPDGVYTFKDYLDEDGVSSQPVPISVKVTIAQDQAIVDFTSSAPQQAGSINAVYAITLSAVYYVIRSLVGLDVPNNAGCLAPITVIAPAGTVLNAQRPAPVAGGNVETSQRIVDVLLGAFAQAAGSSIPAASQGTMNNLTVGGIDPRTGKSFTYYETLAGGAGASPLAPGASAVHTHMTNTLNTPAEALEYAYPLRIIRYEIRPATGGLGRFAGGNGLRRDIQVLAAAQATILSDRRKHSPYGLQGGSPGAVGKNILIRSAGEIDLPAKGTFDLAPGDILSIQTPGGGGFGAASE